ncbi:MAG: ABC transporter ATP-binding protein [Lachnospiraceae bacterium]|nr:ABC transporter ATP-binding protein [Lachnospiraceae bacterium]
MPAIEVKDLKRDYIVKEGSFVRKKKSTIQAVKGISFTVEKGEIFGLLGQNGAGKTTTIKMLITMLAPTSGVCKVLGFDTFGQEKMIRNRINFVFGGELGVYRRLSARDNLKYFANLYKIPLSIRDKRINELLDLVELSDKADLRTETYSKGMIQRVQIARGLLNNPEVLFLDEPTIGLDPLGAEMLRKTIIDINSRGTTILLTTHNMYEADKLCGRIAIIKEGEFLALDSPMAIKAKAAGETALVIEISENPIGLKDKIAALDGVSAVTLDTIEDFFRLRISCTTNGDLQERIISLVTPRSIKSLKNEEITLEDAYIKLVRGEEK